MGLLQLGWFVAAEPNLFRPFRSGFPSIFTGRPAGLHGFVNRSVIGPHPPHNPRQLPRSLPPRHRHGLPHLHLQPCLPGDSDAFTPAVPTQAASNHTKAGIDVGIGLGALDLLVVLTVIATRRLRRGIWKVFKSLSSPFRNPM
jgi:hypothetical protein